MTANPPPFRVAASDPGATTLTGQTLTTFDWLDSRIEEAAARSDLLAARHHLPTQLETSFAPTTVLAISEPASRVLGKVVLGYAPVIDRYQGVIATRLTVVPLRMGVTPDADALLQAIGDVWPAEGGPVVLNVSSELLLAELLRARPQRNVMVEIPWFVAVEPANTAVLQELAARGNTLLLKGRPMRQLPRELLQAFKWSIIDFADDRRLTAPAAPPAGAARSIPHIQSGVHTMAQLQQSFARGAIAVIGWPLRDPAAAPVLARPDAKVVLELIEHLDQGRNADRLDDTLMRDPLLAFELLRHVQGTAPGQLRLETGSFKQAISLLGVQPLRRWLGGMLARTGDDMRLRPVNFAALRRGLLMRQLASASSSVETRGELFMCGVFSLLDRIVGRPAAETLAMLEVPERVRAAIVDGNGPYHPLLELARAIESELAAEIRTAADAAFIEPLEINRALLKTLFLAGALDRSRANPSR
ncbi:MAG TPA: histidine kinase [Burkholderiaceae bacterium]|nr:histidine kinase [Burkholderiaceae bacterium]